MIGPFTGSEVMALRGAEQATDDELDDALTETWDRIAAGTDRQELEQDLMELGAAAFIIARRIRALR
jgi:hypothetical protein